MLNKELLKYNQTLYWVYRRIKESQVKMDKVNELKEYWNCDIILKQKVQEDDTLIFLKEIPELEILN
jgi:hypothetical protein